ncbi:MAG: antibiotic biosynthesis monooxygenase [Bacteroidota bacterium]|nr:antibiotic biosynthesis monooxygenase [Bacteroidota bacterium]
MITRIVKLTIKEDCISEFSKFLKEIEHSIRAVKGCSELQLIQNKYKPQIFMTYSIWNNEADLNNYRNSDLFSTIWPKAKHCFDAKPEADTFIASR